MRGGYNLNKIEGEGAYTWLIPDGYLPREGYSNLPSHEAICILNTSGKQANIELNFYFEDMPAVKGIKIYIPAEACIHFRTDQPEKIGGVKIPYDIPYGIKIVSDEKIVVQYSRADTRAINMTTFTTIAYPIT